MSRCLGEGSNLVSATKGSLGDVIRSDLLKKLGAFLPPCELLRQLEVTHGFCVVFFWVAMYLARSKQF